MIRQLPVIVLVLGLCTLANGDAPTAPSTLEIQTLTPIDSIPTVAEIVNIAGPDPVGRLRELALAPMDGSVDFSVRLRAIRALPQFCTAVPTCRDLDDANMHPARRAVRDVIASISPTTDGQSILQLRAAIESLGVIKSTQQSDVDLLVPFLEHTNRDIRATTARALRDLCLVSATQPLRTRYQQEQVAQVQVAISAALGELDVCSP